VFINPLDGSEPRPVTDFAEGVGAYWWSPDGQWLAVLAPRGEDETGDEEDAEAADDKADWTVYDRLEQPDEYPQLWIVPAGWWTTPDDDREARRLSNPPNHVYHVAWSPDGNTLAVTYNPLFSSLVDEEQRVALVDVETNVWRDISDPERHASYAAFSPDGERVAFLTDREADYRAYLNLVDLVVHDLASGETEVVYGATHRSGAPMARRST
jgi:Tol biopolymer transport system component